jgi:hypothetical protein
MYFECNEGFKGENGLHLPWRYQNIHSNKRDKFGCIVDEEPNSDLALWQSWLWNYGARKLTLPSDKLPAISGIARLLAERLNDEYLAGLWRGSLIEGLLWQGLGARRVQNYRAPSWSWASVDGTPATGMRGQWEPLADIIDCKVEPKGKNMFGEVTSGWIKLKAPLIPLILNDRIDPEETGHPYDLNPKVRTEKGDPDGTHSRFDFPFSEPTGREDAIAMVESLKGVDIFALVLAKSLPEDERDVDTYHALIVRTAEQDSSAMERVGFVLFDPHQIGEHSQLEYPEEQPVVTLV